MANPAVTAHDRMVRFFYLVFFIGGFPSLVYQVVWQRALSVHFGVDIYSTTIAVSVFLFGLGVGSLLGGNLGTRLNSLKAHGVAMVYAIIEIFVGIAGILSLWFINKIGVTFSGGGLGVIVFATALSLLGPATLMGMSLPLMVKIVTENLGESGKRISWLYGINTLGAAFGALATSWFIIGRFGLDGATYIAAAINVAVGVCLVLYLMYNKAEPATAAAHESAVPSTSDSPTLSFQSVLALSFLSGFVAIGLQVVWYRVLVLLLHATVYVFGTMLFILLVGLALGSLLSNRYISNGNWARRFSLTQLGISAYCFLLFGFMGHLSWLPGVNMIFSMNFNVRLNPSPKLAMGEIDPSVLISLVNTVMWPALILFIPAVLMGIGLPNLLREGTNSVRRISSSVGTIYFANVFGSLLGGLLTGFVLLEFIGSEATLMFFVIVSCGVAFWGIFATNKNVGRNQEKTFWTQRNSFAAIGLTVVLTLALFPRQGDLIEAVHFANHDAVEFKSIEDASGVTALRTQTSRIAFAQEKLNTRSLSINGIFHATHSGPPKLGRWGSVDMDAVQMAHPTAKRVLVIGFGDGAVISAISQAPSVEEIVVVELSSSLYELLEDTEYSLNIDKSHAKVTKIVDDGRRWMSANPDQKFDLILMNAFFPYHAGYGTLYSAQHFEQIRGQLAPGGVFMCLSRDLFSTAKTLATVFPYVINVDNLSYMGSNDPITFKIDPDSGYTKAKLAEVLRADQDTILANTQDDPINTDYRLNTEYYMTYRRIREFREAWSKKTLFYATDKDVFLNLISD